MATKKPFRIETHRQVKDRRAKLIGRLERNGSPDALMLAERLSTCRIEAPCLSGACPVCMRRFRKTLLQEGQRVLSRAGLIRVSWIPPRGLVPMGELANLDLARFSAAVLRALQRALPPNAIAIGGIDLSMNVVENRNPVWQLHAYAVVSLPADSSISVADAIAALRTSLPVCAHAKRPLVIDPIDADYCLDRLLSYSMKAQFYRRSSYQYIREKTGRPAWKTLPQALPSTAAVELALFLEQFSIGSRLLLVGVRRYGRGSKFMLRVSR
jgi:hypothetical protein